MQGNLKADLTTLGSCCQYLLEKVIETFYGDKPTSYDIICLKVEYNLFPLMQDTAKYFALGTLLNEARGGTGISFQLGFV